VGLFKSIGKFAKKAVKIIKKAAPIVATLAGGPLGGLVAKGATKLLSVGASASRLKSTGTNLAKAAVMKTASPSTVASVMKLAKSTKTLTTKKAPAKKKTTTKAPAKKKTTTATKSQTALYQELFRRWKATGGVGAGRNEDGLTWEEYASLPWEG